MRKAFTVLTFAASAALDLLTSLVLLGMGYVEMNPLYSLVGSWYWILNVVLNLGILIALLTCSKRWWWGYLLLWIPSLVHMVCGVHNLGFF